MTSLFKNNIWDYYGDKIGHQDIASSIVSEVQRRYYHLSPNEKMILGISDELMSNSRLYKLLQEGRIRAVYDSNSEPGVPGYRLEMDIDGNGSFFELADVLTSGAGVFVPERPVERWKAQNVEEMKAEIINKRASTFLTQMERKGRKLNSMDRWWAKTLATVTTGTEESIRNLSQGLEDVFGIELWDQDFIDKQAQENQLELTLLEKAIKERGVTDTTMFKGDLMVVGEGDERKVIKSENIFYDYITRNEGVELEAYPDIKGIPTIGIGFRLDGEHDDLFKRYGYNPDNLRNKTEKLKLDDTISMFIDDFLPEYMGLGKRNGPFKLYGDVFDFRKQENSYLLLALTDFNHWAGSELSKRTVSYEEDGRTKQKTKMRSGFIGSSTKFHSALKAYGKGEKERLGVWGVDNPNTVMGQMTLDYNAYKTKGGRGAIGMAERIKRNADLIQLWGEGRHARLPLMDAFQTP